MTPETYLRQIDTDYLNILKPELGTSNSAGIALLIIGFESSRNNPLFWTIRELEEKPATDKKRGDLSIPAETRKLGETQQRNLLGALPEFCNDDNLSYVREHLFAADGFNKQKCININGNLVDVSVLIYDGCLSFGLAPLNCTEVAPNKWLTGEQIKSEKRVRTVLAQALDVDASEGLSARIIDTFVRSPQLFKPVLPLDLTNLNELYKKRELQMDVPLVLG